MAELLVGPEILEVNDVQVTVRSANTRLDYVKVPEQSHELSPRENLIVYLNCAAANIDPNNRQHSLPLLRVTMPCYAVKEYQTENNIPVTSDPCTCGHPKHWFLKLIDAEGNIIMPPEKQPKKAKKEQPAEKPAEAKPTEAQAGGLKTKLAGKH